MKLKLSVLNYSKHFYLPLRRDLHNNPSAQNRGRAIYNSLMAVRPLIWYWVICILMERLVSQMSHDLKRKRKLVASVKTCNTCGLQELECALGHHYNIMEMLYIYIDPGVVYNNTRITLTFSRHTCKLFEYLYQCDIEQEVAVQGLVCLVRDPCFVFFSSYTYNSPL